MIDQARQILKSVFGYNRFLSLQEQVITNVLKKRDTLAVMPTGGGKSLCYQIPALIFNGPAIIVSPLISLMKDQVDQLDQLEIPTALLNSSLSDRDYRTNVQRIRQKQARLIYLAPETLMKPAVLDLLAACRVALLAIDEAHCISEWGPDFRPEYRRLAELRPLFSEAVCLALTATATLRVRQDIAASLQLDQAAVLIAGFNRQNLFIQVAEKQKPVHQTLEFIRRFPAESGIVYCFTRKQVNDLAAVLRAKGFAAAAYHAGLTDDERAWTQRQFVRDDVKIVVATIAFGMGIDKSNVRFVLHFDLPKSLESYYQEIGRAGRDGLRADCLLLFSYADTVKARYFIKKVENQQSRRAATLQLNAMVQFAETETCRRIPLLDYFGETFSREQCNDMCDNCVAGERVQVDLTIPAQKFLSSVKRTGERFGAAHVIAVLRGSRAARVLKNGHHRLSTHGIGKEYTIDQWRGMARQFVQQAILDRDQEFGGLRLTAKAWDVLRGRQPFLGSLPNVDQAGPGPIDGNSNKAAQGHRELFDRMRTRRKELAQIENVPPYVIFSDRTLDEMAQRLPQTPEDLLRIHGVGTVKQAKYGAGFLEIIRGYAQEHPGEKPPGPPTETDLKNPPSSACGGKRRHHLVGDAFNSGRSIVDLARDYDVKMNTVADNLWRFMQEGNRLSAEKLAHEVTISEQLQKKALAAFEVLGTQRLRPVFIALSDEVDYDQLKILRMLYIARRYSQAVPPAAIS